MTNDNMTERYAVVDYATYYAVIDQHDKHHKIVFESHNRGTAHSEARKLNKKHRAEQAGQA